MRADHAAILRSPGALRRLPRLYPHRCRDGAPGRQPTHVQRVSLVLSPPGGYGDRAASPGEATSPADADAWLHQLADPAIPGCLFALFSELRSASRASG